jgi:hypothetical protein
MVPRFEPHARGIVSRKFLTARVENLGRAHGGIQGAVSIAAFFAPMREHVQQVCGIGRILTLSLLKNFNRLRAQPFSSFEVAIRAGVRGLIE